MRGRTRFANGGRPFKVRVKKTVPAPVLQEQTSDPLKALRKLERIGRRYQRCRHRGYSHEECLRR